MTNEQEMAIVRWWHARLDPKVAFCADAFALHLGEVLRTIERDDPRALLYVDYDPNKPLLAALRAAGIERRGTFFSADGVFVGQKIGTQIEHGVLVEKNGHGTGWRPIALAG